MTDSAPVLVLSSAAALLPVMSSRAQRSRVVGWVLDPRVHPTGAYLTRGLRTYPTWVLPAKGLDSARGDKRGARGDKKRPDVLEG